MVNRLDWCVLGSPMNLLFFFFAILTCVLAWGPLTHQTYSCKIRGIDLNRTCFESQAMYSVVLGNGAPDSVKYLEPKLHTFEFAAWQFQFAKDYPRSGDFNAIDFSIGFGYHLAQDVVGHHKSSYLSGNNRWMQFAVDSRKVLTSVPDHKVFKWQRYNDMATKFIHAAQVFYSTKNPEYKPHPLDKIAETVKSFDTVIATEVEIARFNTGYRRQQSEYDICKPTTEEQMNKNFDQAYTWSIDASRFAADLIEKITEPKRIEGMVHSYVDAKFTANGGTYCPK